MNSTRNRGITKVVPTTGNHLNTAQNQLLIKGVEGGRCLLKGHRKKTPSVVRKVLRFNKLMSVHMTNLAK